MLGHACSSVFSNFNKERFYGLLTRIGVKYKKAGNPYKDTGFMGANVLFTSSISKLSHISGKHYVLTYL